MIILVTGSNGFIGRNLCARLAIIPEHTVLTFDMDDAPATLEEAAVGADVVFHLAGVNRPTSEQEFQSGNVELTERLCRALRDSTRNPLLIFSSSIQANRHTPYGASKGAAEKLIESYRNDTNRRAIIYRLPNVFGKWCRPNYNSAVATFCHNIARDLPVTVSDPNHHVELVYIDDVIDSWISATSGGDAGNSSVVQPVYTQTLGALVDTIRSFRQIRTTLEVPRLDELTKKLYATYLSYVEADALSYPLSQRSDQRGSLAEFIKLDGGGQMFISRTRPGVTRGNHYHHTKAEKFFVVDGQASICLRHLLNGALIEYRVSGEDMRVVDIPPGYVHAITNVGDTELVTLFWSSEVFDPQRPDTIGADVRAS